MIKIKKRLWSAVIAVFRHSLLVGLSFVILYPMLFMLSNAFKPYAQARDPGVIWIPKSFTLYNISEVIGFMDYAGSLLNTLTYTVLPTLVQLGSCLLVGYGFARFRFPLKKPLFALVLLTVVVPPVSISTGLFQAFYHFNPFGVLGLLNRVTGGGVPNSVNLIGSHWVTFIPAAFAASLRSGIYILIFRQFFASMPRELEEAARIDGCGAFRTFRSVMLPNAQNIAITALMLAIVWNWNDYYTAASFIRAKYTIATSLSELQDFLRQVIGAGADDMTIATTRIQAGVLLGIAPLLAMYLAFQNRLAESIETAGLTGI
ncbi:MAG: carbohydrate ABC transporter permease [Clostridiales bacterium]|nr:carbohydrate ABC transporter permease [Clostridiales bacterium]